MKKRLAVLATGLAVGVAGCSPAPAFDAQAWEPPGDDYLPVACSDLLPEWGGGEAPVACWTFDETTGLQGRFTELAGSMTGHAGSDPVRGPGCMATISCQADWESAEGFVTLASGVSLVGLQAQLDAGQSADPATTQQYELTLWATDELTLPDDQWDEFYEPLAP